LLDQLQYLPLAVEFRSASWAVDKVFDGLAQRRVTLVSVDESDLPGLFQPLDVATNPEFFYVRFLMAATPLDGAPGICRSSSIMIIQMLNCPNGWISGL